MATPNDENTRQFMIYAPDELVRAVKIAAARRDVTASALVRGILQGWLDAYDAEASPHGSFRSSVIARQAPG